MLHPLLCSYLTLRPDGSGSVFHPHHPHTVPCSIHQEHPPSASAHHCPAHVLETRHSVFFPASLNYIRCLQTKPMGQFGLHLSLQVRFYCNTDTSLHSWTVAPFTLQQS